MKKFLTLLTVCLALAACDETPIVKECDCPADCPVPPINCEKECPVDVVATCGESWDVTLSKVSRGIISVAINLDMTSVPNSKELEFDNFRVIVDPATNELVGTIKLKRTPGTDNEGVAIGRVQTTDLNSFRDVPHDMNTPISKELNIIVLDDQSNEITQFKRKKRGLMAYD